MTTIARGTGTIRRGVKIIGAIELKNGRRARIREEGACYVRLEIGTRCDTNPFYLEEVKHSFPIHKDEINLISQLFQQVCFSPTPLVSTNIVKKLFVVLFKRRR